MKRQLPIVVILTALLILMLTQTAAMQQETDSRVQFGGDVVVAPEELLSGDVVALGGNVIVNGVVAGSASAIGGQVLVAGLVGGDVTAIGGDVVLRSTARVGGSATSVGGQLRQDPGAEVRGDTTSVPFALPLLPLLVLGLIIQRILFLIIPLIAIVLAVGVFPRQVQIVEQTVKQASWPSLGVGLAVLVLSLFLAVPLAFTIIGLPLALLALVAATLFGLAAIGALIGERFLAAVDNASASYLVKAIVGIVIIWIINLIPVVGWLFFLVVNLIGLGAVTLSRFGNIAPPFSWQGPRSSPPSA